jgi:hypothetical protein
MPPVIVANTGMVATAVMVAIVMVPASGSLARLPLGIHGRKLLNRYPGKQASSCSISVAIVVSFGSAI